MKTEGTSRLPFLNRRVLTGFALYAAGLVLALAVTSSAAAEDDAAAELSQSASAQVPGRWRATGDLITARSYHTGTLLLNGQVLVAGGMAVSTCKRGTIRSGDRGMDSYRQHGHCTRKPNGNVAAERTGTGGRRYWQLSKRGTIRSGDWGMDSDGQPRHWTLVTHGDVATEWSGAGGRRRQRLCRTVRSGYWGVESGRHNGHGPRRGHGNVAAGWEGAGGRRLCRPFRISKHGIIRSGDQELDGQR